jgi:L-threonylcarbamoyladenylate synthase
LADREPPSEPRREDAFRLQPRAAASLDAAIAALKAGELVIMPTETVYGLAADASNPVAVAKIFEAKGRPRFNPLIAHVTDLSEAQALARLDARAVRLAEAFWPGPLTIVAPVGPTGGVCELARAGLDSVALRAPAHPVARALIAGLGGALVAPSANRSGRPSPTTLADATDETGAFAAAALEGGASRLGLESTVVGLIDGPARLLRPGFVTRDEIESLIGPLADPAGDAGRSPGSLTRHYAPRAPVRLDVVEPLAGEAFLAFGAAAPGPLVFNLSPGGVLLEAAANLFSMLRAADGAAPTAIAVAPIPQAGLGEAINDRLRRAAGHVG